MESPFATQLIDIVPDGNYFLSTLRSVAVAGRNINEPQATTTMG